LSAAWFEESERSQSREEKVGAGCIPKEQEEQEEQEREEGQERQEGEEGEERWKTNGGWRCKSGGEKGGEVVPSTTSAVLVLLVLLDLRGRHSVHQAERGLGLSTLL
jgi:hypothetical protein